MHNLKRRLSVVRKERESLTVEVDKHDYLIKSLRDTLGKLQSDKIALENKLEAEQEHILNNFSKKLEALQAEKRWVFPFLLLVCDA